MHTQNKKKSKMVEDIKTLNEEWKKYTDSKTSPVFSLMLIFMKKSSSFLVPPQFNIVSVK